MLPSTPEAGYLLWAEAAQYPSDYPLVGGLPGYANEVFSSVVMANTPAADNIRNSVVPWHVTHLPVGVNGVGHAQPLQTHIMIEMPTDGMRRPMLVSGHIDQVNVGMPDQQGTPPRRLHVATATFAPYPQTADRTAIDYYGLNWGIETLSPAELAAQYAVMPGMPQVAAVMVQTSADATQRRAPAEVASYGGVMPPTPSQVSAPYGGSETTQQLGNGRSIAKPI
jgi:hypothetical protein